MGKSRLEVSISDSIYTAGTEFDRTHKQYMRAMVPASPKLRILDVGCGTGVNAAVLSENGHQVVGIDLSPVAIEQYCTRGFEGHVCDIESEPLPFESGSFDLVYAAEVIEHCADTAAFLQELNRMLRPGGQLLLSTSNSAFWPYRILGMLGQTATDLQHPGHVRFFSRKGLSDAVEKSGFEIADMAGRHMYCVLGKGIGDPIAPVLKAIGFRQEPRYTKGDNFWQFSRLVPSASSFWADTFIIRALKTR
jgi:2-polyprenyl-3-methyl-5-hydroxy-6-metoxy-1,4-benzoquinol methylase